MLADRYRLNGMGRGWLTKRSRVLGACQQMRHVVVTVLVSGGGMSADLQQQQLLLEDMAAMAGSRGAGFSWAGGHPFSVHHNHTPSTLLSVQPVCLAQPLHTKCKQGKWMFLLAQHGEVGIWL